MNTKKIIAREGLIFLLFAFFFLFLAKFIEQPPEWLAPFVILGYPAYLLIRFVILKRRRRNKMRNLWLIVLLISITCLAQKRQNNDMTNTIKATVGKEFAITLNANATTGYEW